MKATIKEIKKTRVDALYGKKKHFNAADRKRWYKLGLNIPVILFNILLGGSLLFTLLEESSPEAAKVSAAIFSFLAAAMVGISTFFNFTKQVEGHRKVGNIFLEIVKKCNLLLALYQDEMIDDAELMRRYEEILDLNLEANRGAEAYSTSQSDYKKAQKGIKEDGEEEYLPKELGE